MQAARHREEDATLRRHGGKTIEQIPETGSTGLARMGTLDRLGELHGITNKDNILRGGADGDDIGKRDLSRLVDQEIVELLIVLRARKEPGGPGDQRIGRQPRIIIVPGNLDRWIRRQLAVGKLLDRLGGRGGLQAT